MRKSGMIHGAVSSVRTCPPVRYVSTRGFTLLEMMAATAIFVVLMLVIFQITQTTSKVWKKSTLQITSLQEARAAFEAMTRRISQATLSVYYGYDNPNNPAHYLRRSELQFICGKGLIAGQVTSSIFFQVPLGYTNDTTTYGNMQNTLNACGYYVVYGKDPAVPGFLQNLVNPPNDKYRFRLMEYLQPTQSLSVYTPNNMATVSGGGWIQSNTDNTRVMAENVVTLIVMPMLSPEDQGSAASSSLSSNYEYDSQAGAVGSNGKLNYPQQQTTNQLPPIVQVAMVVIDEDSAIRLKNSQTEPNLGLSSLFQDTSKFSSDLAVLENNLAAEPGNAAGNTTRLNYYVFQTNVAIRAAKWSQTPNQ